MFCTAMLAYNGMRVMAAALTAVHGEAVVRELSPYSQSLEIVKGADGLSVLFTEAEWKSLLPKTAQGLAKPAPGLSHQSTDNDLSDRRASVV